MNVRLDPKAVSTHLEPHVREVPDYYAPLRQLGAGTKPTCRASPVLV